MRERIPVILDTDIGGDIDDTWALAMLLRSPELDVRLVVSARGDTEYRAMIIAKMLQVAGRTDVPVGVGIPSRMRHRRQGEWVNDYDLADYPGTVCQDGVGTMTSTIMEWPEPVTVISIGPASNTAEALRRETRIAEKARFVGMHGSIYKGPGGLGDPVAEANVRNDVGAFRRVLEADWDITITPVDTCGSVRLEGEKYRAVRDCPDPLVRAVIENYRIWARGMNSEGYAFDPDTHSSVLWDTVAVYLAFSEELLAMKRLPIAVTDDGHTVVDHSAKEINCALEWRDLDAFEDLLVERLTGF